MAIAIEAVYQNGAFQALEPISISEGQRVRLMIEVESIALSTDEIRTRLQAGGLLANLDDIPDDIPEISTTEFDRLRQLFSGSTDLAHQIIEDRGLE